MYPSLSAGRKASETRIQKQGYDHGFHTPELVAQHPEDNSASRPTEQHPRRRPTNILLQMPQGGDVTSEKFFQR
jgi:hypothetical protein